MKFRYLGSDPAHLVAGLESVDVDAQVPVGVALQARVLVKHVRHRRGIQAPEGDTG